MKKYIPFLIALLFMGTSIISQETIVEWNFPDDSADSIADGGIEENLGKGIYTMGGTSNISYKNGFETKAAQVTNWQEGAELKCFVVEFSTQLYGDVALSCKLSSGGNDPGPRDFRVDYKVGEEGNWLPVPNSEITTANDWETGVLDSLPLPHNEFYNQQSVYLRWITTSDTSSAGTLVEPSGKIKIDDIVITATSIIGVDELFSSQIKIYPNPFTETVILESVNEIGLCKVFDLSGKAVYSSLLNEESQKLNLSELQSGFYSIQFFDRNGQVIINKKIIKQ